MKKDAFIGFRSLKSTKSELVRLAAAKKRTYAWLADHYVVEGIKRDQKKEAKRLEREKKKKGKRK